MSVVKHVVNREYVVSLRQVLQQWMLSCFTKMKLQQIKVCLVAVGYKPFQADPERPCLSEPTQCYGFEQLDLTELMVIRQPGKQMVDIRFSLPSTPLSDQDLVCGQGKWVVQVELHGEEGDIDTQMWPVPALPDYELQTSWAV